MKSLSSILISLIITGLSFSCIPEEDFIEENAVIEIISQEGEITTITGSVMDTSSNHIPNANIKLVFENLELETESNNNGVWTLNVPSSLNEGYIVVHKVNYSKSIQKIRASQPKEIYETFIAIDPSSEALNLSLRVSDLKTVLGQVVNQDLTPKSDVDVFLFSDINSTGFNTAFHGYLRTDESGNFEFIYEDNGYISTTLAGTTSDLCGYNFQISIESEDKLVELPNIIIPPSSSSTFVTNLENDGSNCYDKATAIVHYTGNTPDKVQHNLPLGEINIEYCPTENSVFFIGIESNDKTYFNGSFFPESDIQENYSFDICTPNQSSFIELSINGTTTLYEDNLSFEGGGAIKALSPTSPLSFSVFNSFSSFDPGSNNLIYGFGQIRSFSLQGPNEIAFNNIDITAPQYNFVNIVQDDIDFFSGLGHIITRNTNNETVDIKIRYKVAK